MKSDSDESQLPTSRPSTPSTSQSQFSDSAQSQSSSQSQSSTGRPTTPQPSTSQSTVSPNLFMRVRPLHLPDGRPNAVDSELLLIRRQELGQLEPYARPA
ncbi:hypothetical protein Pcinc_039629 [Petrolisthes cinctipes]|uniref:Uncharacterized protein n=1 Tax=Petrolisthes cinctipes TaxID=88211 RepID=A0AAE1BNB4_PETCI|nr:hypothetical protein Pcinc_039629 [Petrolisthes cinctipes]